MSASDRDEIRDINRRYWKTIVLLALPAVCFCAWYLNEETGFLGHRSGDYNCADEQTLARKRAAEQQGGAFIHDPRRGAEWAARIQSGDLVEVWSYNRRMKRITPTSFSLIGWDSRQTFTARIDGKTFACAP